MPAAICWASVAVRVGKRDTTATLRWSTSSSRTTASAGCWRKTRNAIDRSAKRVPGVDWRKDEARGFRPAGFVFFQDGKRDWCVPSSAPRPQALPGNEGPTNLSIEQNYVLTPYLSVRSFDPPSVLILMLRKATSLPWSCKSMCPLASLPKLSIWLNLLAATRLFQSSLPNSYSATFSPLSQCSTWLPFTTMRVLFHSPMGLVTSLDGAYRA